MIYVDIPTKSCFDDDDDGEYVNVAQFPTMAEAVEYLRHHLGHECVTDNGFVKLTMGGDESAQELVVLKSLKAWMEDCLMDRQQEGLPSRTQYDAVCAAIAKATGANHAT